MKAETQSIDDYFLQYGKCHVRTSREILKPLHTPGEDAAFSFDDVTRKPFEPQAHLVTAAVKMMDASKRGVIAAEMGTGKSIMGCLSVHKHASRSIRRGGRNGRYRALVLCPDHLISKWKGEIVSTIPGATVVTFDAASKGCKVLIGEIAEMRRRIRGEGDRWSKPGGPEFYILGRDQAKFLPERANVVGPMRKTLERYEDEKAKNKLRVEISRHHVCPKCGKPVVDAQGSPIEVRRSNRLLKCKEKYVVPVDGVADAPDADVRNAQSRVSQFRAGQILHANGHKFQVRVCGEPLWQFTRKPFRWAPAAYIHTHMRNAFTYLIVDELHEQKGDAAAQAIACGKLIASTRYCLALTGTLIGGYANHLYPILFRLQPGSLVGEGFKWGAELPFIRKYGRIEKIVTIKDGGESTVRRNSRSMRKERKADVQERPAPGIMPGLFGRHLLDKAIFLSLEEMAANLPKFREYVGGPPRDDYDGEDAYFHADCRIKMLPAQAEEYARIEKILVDTNRVLLQEGNSKLLGAMLQTLLGYADRPWGWGEVGYNLEGTWIPVVEPMDLDDSIIYPKEQAYIDMVEREVAAGNQVWTYCQMTNKRDVQPRLKKLLEDRGLRVAILRSRSVKPKDRLAWIDKVGKTVDVVISHPQLVQTGIDFFNKERTHNFNAIAFYQTGYNSFTMRQAARRAWRIGQEKSCRVYYFYYEETAQHGAMKLMARKAAAAQALDGQMTADGFAAMADDESAAMALARSITAAIKDADDVARNWTKVGGTKTVRAPRAIEAEEEPEAAAVQCGRGTNLAIQDYLLDFMVSDDNLDFLMSL